MCRSKTQRLSFSLSVSFSDITKPADPVFASLPVLEAKFPHDFFYPFVSSNSLSVILSSPSKLIFIFHFYMLLRSGK